MQPIRLLCGLMGIGLLALLCSSAAAQDRRFPYEALVDVDEEFVRCGPGPKYYPTSKVKRGQRVTVHRHDPGGWAMIAPPADSFSWIQAEYVQKSASGRGALTANNVIVHVGSTLGTERSVYQRSLSKGDTVEILGEQTFATDRGPSRMYQIKPPPREYRWIAGKSIIPADGRTAPAMPGKPAGPAKTIPFIQGPIASDLKTEVAAEDDAFASPFEMSPPAKNVSKTAPAELESDLEFPVSSNAATNAGPEQVATLEALRQELAELDGRFRTMLQQDPQTWDLARLRREYQDLERRAQHPAFTNHVRQRLGTIQRYDKIHAEYIDFYRLTTSTQERDAQLLAQQRQYEQQLQQFRQAPTDQHPPNMAPLPIAAAPPANPTPAFPVASRSSTAPGPTPLPAGSESGSASGTPASPQPPRFSGAGIVQRSSIPAPGLPPYMLVAPDGRLLAYLEPAPGIDLTTAQNQALGIIGERGFRDALQADVITVRGFQPVALRTAVRE